MDERDPVDDSEFVYRRIHVSFVNPAVPIPVQLPAFRPNANDVTGLSVFREAFVSPADTLAAVDVAKVKEYYVARLAVASLRNLGLSVRPEPVPGGPLGHAVIPELSWQAYQADKRRWKPIIAELAKLASADIVHRPS
jgi:hypothetical protein